LLVFEVTTVPEPGQKISSEHSGPWIRVTIRDTGCGLPEDADQVFEPYVTTKATGTGLGLAVARRIIEDNGGCLWAESSKDGAAFIIDLPDVSRIDESKLALPERNSS
jgi:signal transduction histidine kinase